jgi:hypothetical protein
MHHVGLEDFLPVDPRAEHDAAGRRRRWRRRAFASLRDHLVDADHRDELRRDAAEIDRDVTVGLQRQRVRICDPAEFEHEGRRWRRGSARPAAAPDRDVREIETVDPDAVRRRVGTLERGGVLAAGKRSGKRDRECGREQQTNAHLKHDGHSTAATVVASDQLSSASTRG